MRRAAFAPEVVYDAIIQQESGGRPGVKGPPTQYGQAVGLSQMLPGTAQQMAKKLGVPYRADLMHGKSSEAAAYQKALGYAYFQQGLSETGNFADAIKYYHGGPNRKIWGPKTRGYLGDVLGRLGVK